jgi:CRP-like cAMP-binding protein
MSIDEDIAFLEQVPALSMLDGQALRILAIGAESRRIANGAALYYAGDLADGGYVIQEGSFVLERDSGKDGDGVTVGPGVLLGETALVTATICTSTAIALEPSVVLRIPRSLFLKMLEGYPSAARKLRDAMAARLETFGEDVARVKAMFEKNGNGNAKG